MKQKKKLEADILHLVQKAARCTTCKQPFGKVLVRYSPLARQWPENGSTSFETRFAAKFPRANAFSGAASSTCDPDHIMSSNGSFQ